ncbi:dolichol kinase [Massospora cicadina]|nr:dolichol kinase [Massospora cicadina]
MKILCRGLELLSYEPTRHLEALLLLATSLWSLNNLTLSEVVDPGLNFAYSSLLFLSALVHVFSSPNPSVRERLLLMPRRRFRGNAAPGLILASLLPPLVLASKLLSSPARDLRGEPRSMLYCTRWALHLGLSLIFGLSLLTQSILGLYLSLLAPLTRFSGFILKAQDSPLYTLVSLALYHGLLYTVPYFMGGNFTLGELSLVCQGLSLLSLEALAIVLPGTPFDKRAHAMLHQAPEVVILCGAVLGVFLVGLVVWGVLLATDVAFNRKLGPWARGATFYGTFLYTVMFVIRPPIAGFIGSDPFLWPIRCALLSDQPKFFYLGLVAAFAALVLLEYIRILAIEPFHAPLHSYLTSFVDEKDSGVAILAHLYLLVGCALPVWFNSSDASGLSGILVLGIGDAMASVVGKRFGRTRWPGSSKTVQGTTGFVLSLSVALLALHPKLSIAHFPWVSLKRPPVYFAASNFDARFLEAWSSQNDNLTLPLYLMATIQLAHPPGSA